MNAVETNLLIAASCILAIFIIIYVCYKLFVPKDPSDRRYLPVQLQGPALGDPDVPTRIPLTRPQYFMWNFRKNQRDKEVSFELKETRSENEPTAHGANIEENCTLRD